MFDDPEVNWTYVYLILFGGSVAMVVLLVVGLALIDKIGGGA